MSPVTLEDAPTPTPPSGVPTGRGAGFMTWLRGLSLRRRWLNLLLAILLIAAVILAFRVIGNPTSTAPVERTATVTRGTVTASVTGSGNTESSVATPVSFITNGVVTAINVKPGDKVTNGQPLATIDPATATNNLRTAQAQLAGDQAALAQAAAGPTAVKQQQDQAAIAIAQQSLNSANATLANVKKQQSIDQSTLSTAVSNAQKALDIAQRSADTSVQAAQASFNTTEAQQNQTVSNACSVTTTTAPTTSNSSAAPTTKATAPATAAPLIQLNAYSVPMTTSDSSACTNAKNVRDSTLRQAQIAITTAKNSAATSVNSARTALDSAKRTQTSTLAADQGNIISSQQAVNSAQGDLTNAQLTAQADLHPQTPDQIAQAAATVDSAQVAVTSAQQALDQTTITAPQDGTVLAVNGHVGQVSGSGSSSAGTSSTGGTGSTSNASATSSSTPTGFIVIANQSELAVTADIAEADAAKIKLGQLANVTFPATGATAQGSVTQITPQSTVTNNVVLYPVQVSLNTTPAGVGVGATASLSVTTGTAVGVLQAPTSAITTLGDRHTVTVRRNGTDTVVPIEIGLTGDTNTEITSGVNDGDVLILPTTVAGAAGGAAGGTGARTGGG